MTIQVAVMNGYGVALASDRHVFRGSDIRSTGQEVKLLRLRGEVPAAMMCAGPFAVSGLPVSRLALRLERALAEPASGPEALATSVLRSFDEVLDGPLEPVSTDALEPVSRAPSGDLFVTVGLVCPHTGVPAMLALRLGTAPGNRLLVTSRLDRDYEVAWRAGRTVVMAQGTGRALIEAMVDGLGEEHWAALPGTGRNALRKGMEDRWDHAHATLGVASPRELAAVASGLVRGAEVIGFLTRESEATVSEVDWICLTPRDVAASSLDAGPPPRVAV